MNIAAVTKHFRKQANLTQEQLATKARVSYSTIAKIERGAIKDPSFTTVIALTSALGCTLEDFTSSNALLDTNTSTSGDIKFVYCDVNGVLVRFYQRAFVSMAKKINREVGQVETAFWHYNAAVNKGEITTAKFDQLVAKRLDVKSIDWQSEYMAEVEAVKVMHACLRKIIKTTDVGLLTNIFPDFINPMIKNGLVPDLKYASIIDSSEVGAIKPESEIYKVAEKIANVKGSEILFIDDSRTNLMEAEKHGWQVLWFDDYRPEDSVKRVFSALKISN